MSDESSPPVQLEAGAGRVQVRQAAAAAAQAGVAHAEIVVQQRLNNFLLAASILLLGASATIVADPTAGRRFLMVSLAFVGIALSISWAFLGLRMIKFIQLNQEILEGIESGFVGDADWLGVNKKIAQLRRGEEVVCPVSRSVLRLGYMEKWIRSSNLLAIAPVAFCVAFVIVGILGVRGWAP